MKIKVLILFLLLISTSVYSAEVILSIEHKSIPIYTKPNTKSKVLMRLEPGLILRATDMNRETGLIYYQVLLPNGKLGWVCETHLLIWKQSQDD